MASINERVAQLQKETVYLRKEINELKETLKQQNELIIQILSAKRQNDKVNIKPNASETSQLNESHKNTTKRRYTTALSITPCTQNVFKGSHSFPIDTIEDLERYDQEINEDNKQYNIDLLKSLLMPEGLLKNFANIISDKLSQEINVSGHYKKKGLLRCTHFVKVLFEASYKEGYTKKDFVETIRVALKRAKNRHNKNSWAARKRGQRLREEDPYNSGMIEDESDDETQCLVKTEEIYFE